MQYTCQTTERNHAWKEEKNLILYFSKSEEIFPVKQPRNAVISLAQAWAPEPAASKSNRGA